MVVLIMQIYITNLDMCVMYVCFVYKTKAESFIHIEVISVYSKIFAIWTCPATNGLVSQSLNCN